MRLRVYECRVQLFSDGHDDARVAKSIPKYSDPVLYSSEVCGRFKSQQSSIFGAELGKVESNSLG